MEWDTAQPGREDDCVCPEADKPGPCNEACPRNGAESAYLARPLDDEEGS